MTKHLPFRWLLLAAALLLIPQLTAQADQLTDQMTKFAASQTATIPVTSWKFHQPDIAGGESVDFDDSAWQTVAPGFTWSGVNTNCWFRTRYVVPPTINGVSTEGAEIGLLAGMDDDAEIYVNGKLIDKFHWDDGHCVLTEHAHPGETIVIALRGINGPGTGGLHFSTITYDLLGAVQPEYGNYLREVNFVAQIAPQAPADQQKLMTQTLAQSEAQVDQTALQARDWAKLGPSLATAQKTLLALAPITKQYDVYYVGHAHIDMNWLWTWPETIDVCHRTWDSAMHLMDLFPDFGFVQSQPGAYVPIQQQYPAEFAKMQQETQRGKWDPVGGLWDESDTDMPSGEGLARSFFLGQTYFKANFGQYATTGWLPDSFGHSWQMPQLMQEAGITNYYHMRCGDGVRFAWWESPDGSRVLKANTDSYDEPVTLQQLTRPWTMERDYGLKQALVVFGVGDHGGGPTRDQILVGKGFQADPLFPKVHFVTADEFFKQLRAKPQTKSLPVIDTDLQYVFVGCYTTHADMKKAVRSSENNLYVGEVFSSLASMEGQPYPVQAFDNAWKPTAFAQFHDIMCGSAIHSTYDWMHEQLAPAFAFEQKQTASALATLTAHADTRGAKTGEQPVVVWNALSFPRTDVVTLKVANSANYHSARAQSGAAVPVQALDSRTVAFVAANIPAFGHGTYFLSKSPVPHAALAKQTGDSIILENQFERVTLAKSTGLITSLYDKKLRREMIEPGHPGNLLQVLGDKGSAWDINYTGEQHMLTTGATVQLIASGPVCAIVRVVHKFNKSTYTQDVTLYSGLPQVNVPTTVAWHEHGQLLKVAFPLNMDHPAARVGIPYGSIDRPDNGQENPGQKWMDVTNEEFGAISAAHPINLKGAMTNRSTDNFDTQKRAYPTALMPAAGVRRLGPGHIPFNMPGDAAADNIACSGQTISIPQSATGGTLYLLGAGALKSQGGALTLVLRNGQRETRLFQLGDWVTGGGANNKPGMTFDYRITETGAHDSGAKPHLWIVPVPVPAGQSIKEIILPDNPLAHIFAMTIANAPTAKPLYGMTVLNDCKYGSDTNGNVFRLTLLRSSGNPDPNPDEGTQKFTYALLPHAGDWRTAQSEQAGLALNIPLSAVVTSAHPGNGTPILSISPSANVVAGALKHADNGKGYILRIFETQGRNTPVRLTFDRPVQVTETNLLELPIKKHQITTHGKVVTFQIGHDQIVTLHITGLPDAVPTVQAKLERQHGYTD